MKYSLVAIRRFVLFSVLLSALAVVCVSATDINLSLDGLPIFVVINLAAGVFATLTTLFLLLLESIPRAAQSTPVWAEFSALGVSLFFFIAAGVTTALEGLSWCTKLGGLGPGLCNKWSITQAFIILSWVLLKLYLVTLLVFVVRARRCGMKGWSTSVRTGFYVPVTGQRIVNDEEALTSKSERQDPLRGQVI